MQLVDDPGGASIRNDELPLSKIRVIPRLPPLRLAKEVLSKPPGCYPAFSCMHLVCFSFIERFSVLNRALLSCLLVLQHATGVLHVRVATF